MDRLYAVKRPFAATTAWISSTSRIFKPGETLWWDEEGLSYLFKVDGFRWHPEDMVQFAQSIERFESYPSAQPSETPANGSQNKFSQS